MLFVLFGILLISFVVWMIDEEMEVLYEMPEVDTSLFKHNITELYTLLPFFYMAFVIFVNIMIITTETIDEIWFYMRNNTSGIKILNTILAFYIIILVFLCY